jgi:hypothetical protein
MKMASYDSTRYEQLAAAGVACAACTNGLERAVLAALKIACVTQTGEEFLRFNAALGFWAHKLGAQHAEARCTEFYRVNVMEEVKA